jgi:hypothetical protein
VRAIHTPAELLSPAQRFSLFRTLQLAATGALEPADYRSGQTALAHAAALAPATVAALIDTPAAGIGPDLAAELRDSHKGVLLASLNRQTVQVPARALDPLIKLYREAASPIGAPPATNVLPGGRSW